MKNNVIKYLEYKITAPKEDVELYCDDCKFFDEHVKEVDEDIVRTFKDSIDWIWLYDNRQNKKCKSFNKDFVRELARDETLDEILRGEIVCYESGLYEYIYSEYIYEEITKINKKLIDEFKELIEIYFKDVYGQNYENAQLILSQDEYERLKQYVEVKND